jgi:hypothetical protein
MIVVINPLETLKRAAPKIPRHTRLCEQLDDGRLKGNCRMHAKSQLFDPPSRHPTQCSTEMLRVVNFGSASSLKFSPNPKK